MTERLVISVDPGPLEQSQTVQDVFSHVLDLFDLLRHGGDAEDDVIAWRLVRVSMNSPLRIEAEAIAVRPPPPGVSHDSIAQRQSRTFRRNIAELKDGRVPDAWRGARELQRVRRAFFVAKGVSTRVALPDEQDEGVLDAFVEIVPADVPKVDFAIQEATNEAQIRPKAQRGSIEGHFLEVGTYYNKPAIKLQERKSGAPVWCVVSDSHRAEIASETSFDDVWTGRRVLVEGVLFYDDAGFLSKVVADAVRVLEARRVDELALHDPEATLGLSTAEYLERFREGSLG